jgi:putative nucleotidyltransferase with HDIG domain
MASTAANPLDLLLEVGQALHSNLEIDPLLDSILKLMQRAVESEGASIWLLNTDQTRITCTNAIGPHAEDVLDAQVPAEDFLALWQARSGQAIHLVAGTPAWAAADTITTRVRPGTRDLIISPLEARGLLMGVVSVVNKIGAEAFSEDERTLVQALAGHATIALQNAQLYEQQARNAQRQKLLEQISYYFQETLNLDALIPRIFKEVNQAINAEGQSLWLLSADGQTLTCLNATGAGAHNVINLTVPADRSIVGDTVRTQEPLLIEDAQRDPRLNRSADSKTGLVTRTLMSVPMVREGISLGALQAINKRGGELFTPDDLYLFTSIASSAAMAIENARLYRELQNSYDLTLYAMTAALDLRDRETEGHSRRVVAYTLRLAQQMGLDENVMENIRRGALLHDVGKIGIPDRVLHKPGPLDADERRVIETHPQKGYDMLLGIGPLNEAVKIVLAHHEKWDGSGYPLGLKGENIPLGARLFALADVFDALTSERPYRQPMTLEAAREVIGREMGTHFDPQAVVAFMAIPVDEWTRIREAVMVEVSRRRQDHEALVRRGRTGLLNPNRLPPEPR